MQIIISPAKRMRSDPDSLPCTGLPRFLQEAEILLQRLQSMPPAELRNLWRCSETIAARNVERLRTMELRKRLTPAILAFEGIQYQYMAPGVFEELQFQYVQKHLRILSGFYGILRPFDGVAPYRLEMQAKLAVEGHADLYGFWGDRLASVLAQETDWIVNLASREYSRAVTEHLPASVRVVSCTFADRVNGKLVEKGTICKMARGRMVRFLAENSVEKVGEMQAFDQLGYRFSRADSAGDSLVFIREIR